MAVGREILDKNWVVFIISERIEFESVLLIMGKSNSLRNVPPGANRENVS